MHCILILQNKNLTQKDKMKVIIHFKILTYAAKAVLTDP
jgi:hypothetical protein